MPPDDPALVPDDVELPAAPPPGCPPLLPSEGPLAAEPLLGAETFGVEVKATTFGTACVAPVNNFFPDLANSLIFIFYIL